MLTSAQRIEIRKQWGEILKWTFYTITVGIVITGVWLSAPSGVLFLLCMIATTASGVVSTWGYWHVKAFNAHYWKVSVLEQSNEKLTQELKQARKDQESEYNRGFQEGLAHMTRIKELN